MPGGMDRQALAAAVEQLLYVLGRQASETSSVQLEPGTVTWTGIEGECLVERTWSGVLPDLLDWPPPRSTSRPPRGWVDV